LLVAITRRFVQLFDIESYQIPIEPMMDAEIIFMADYSICAVDEEC